MKIYWSIPEMALIPVPQRRGAWTACLFRALAKWQMWVAILVLTVPVTAIWCVGDFLGPPMSWFFYVVACAIEGFASYQIIAHYIRPFLREYIQRRA
jgi:hypothetical protein